MNTVSQRGFPSPGSAGQTGSHPPREGPPLQKKNSLHPTRGWTGESELLTGFQAEPENPPVREVVYAKSNAKTTNS